MIVVRELRERAGTIPGSDLGVVERGGVLMGAGNEVFGKFLADLLRRHAVRPVVEVVLLSNNLRGTRPASVPTKYLRTATT